MRIFSDKEIFTVNQNHNCLNDRWIAIDRSDIKGIYKTKHPQQVMVLGIIASNGKRMPPIFNSTERLNKEKYYSILRYKV